MEILSVIVHAATLNFARNKVREFLNSPGQHKIFTPNPEMVVKAQKDGYFKQVLNSGDLNLCDGFGLLLASRWLSSRRKSGSPCLRIPGADFMVEICRIAQELGKGVFLLGSGSDEVASKTAENLQKQFPGLKIVGNNKGPVIEEQGTRNKEQNFTAPFHVPRPMLHVDCVENEEVIHKINLSEANILFVAFGMGKQEKWIHENLPKLPGVKIAMGVGGAFDYISGKVSRAPLFLRQIGLEWVYRLARQPARIGRIINATLVFAYCIIKEKINLL